MEVQKKCVFINVHIIPQCPTITISFIWRDQKMSGPLFFFIHRLCKVALS